MKFGALPLLARLALRAAGAPAPVIPPAEVTSRSWADKSTGATSANDAALSNILRQTAGAELGFDLTPWVDGSTLLAWLIVSGAEMAASEVAEFRIVLERSAGGNVESTAVTQRFAGPTHPAGVMCALRVPALIATPAPFRLRAQWATGGVNAIAVAPGGALGGEVHLLAQMVPP